MATSTSENLQDVAQSARETLAQQKDGAANHLGNLAGTLRKAARESDGGADAPAAHMTEWAADALERVSATLRSNDLNGMMRQVESFARSQPVAFFFAAAATGFLATRFLKAGARASPAQQDGAGPQAGSQREPGSYQPSGGAIDKTDAASTAPL